MTSRRLWLLLSLLAVPLVLETITGCDLVFQLDPPGPDTNAYTCECACNAGDRQLASPVGASADDGDQRVSDGTVILGGDELRIATDFLTGVRFTGLGIPQGATIASAHVQFTAARDGATLATVAIRVEASDDAQPFTTANSDLSNRPLGGSVMWAPPVWTANAQGAAQRADSLAPLVQEVVSRSGWTTSSSLVLIFAAAQGDRLPVAVDRDSVKAPTLHVTFVDTATTVAARLPVCLPEELNPALNPNAANPDADGPDADGDADVLVNDCENRVEKTYEGLVGACGYVVNPTPNCDCRLVQTNFEDTNKNGAQDPGEAYFGFVREVCNEGEPVCPERLVSLPGCENFDPKAFSDCVAQNPGDPDPCLSFVSATNAMGDEPVCVADSHTTAQSMAFRMFGQRSTCEVTGLSEIRVGDDGREPKQDPLTRGIVEILGEPCPGESCAVGIETQLAMNPITFSVKWAKDPTFKDLIQSSNSALRAATLNGSGVGAVPEQSTSGVGRGRRGSKRQAYFAANGSPLGLVVDWSGRVCSLDGNLASTVDAEDIDGTCAGDDLTPCRADSPDCDGVGGPCEFPPDPEPFLVDVALAGSLLNQPPKARAGNDQTVECTSPSGAIFVLDGTQSSDPDGDISIASWRSGSRVGPELAANLNTTAALGVGESRTFVLRTIDAFAQADEDAIAVGVVDTTPPDVFCNAPATITPPATPVSFTATATDICTADQSAPEIVSFECFKVNGAGKTIDKTKSCRVTLAGDTIAIRNSGGVGNHIRWTAEAVDGSGNVGDVTCEVEVVKPGHSM